MGSPWKYWPYDLSCLTPQPPLLLTTVASFFLWCSLFWPTKILVLLNDWRSPRWSLQCYHKGFHWKDRSTKSVAILFEPQKTIQARLNLGCLQAPLIRFSVMRNRSVEVVSRLFPLSSDWPGNMFLPARPLCLTPPLLWCCPFWPLTVSESGLLVLAA
jgi:hypothetical protein